MLGRKIIFCLVGGILVFSGMTGCISVDLKPKDIYEEKLVAGNEKGRDKILLLPIEGLIMNEAINGLVAPNACTPSQIREQLQLAARDKNIKGIILEINSPGGGVTASDIIYRHIINFKKEHPDLPVVALMKDTAASGGYYIAMSADHIVAHETTITGSIGVISVFVVFEDVLKWAKISVEVIKSGEAKDMGSPFRKMTDKEKEDFQKIINQMYEGFVDIVVEGRRGLLTRSEVKDLANGRIFTGRDALKAKLVDATGYLEDAVEQVKKNTQVAEPKIVRYHKVRGVLETAFRLEGPASELTWLKQLVMQDGSSKFMYLWLPARE